MASRFETCSKDEIWAIIEAVIKTNTTKATNFGLSLFIFLLNLPQNCKSELDKIPEMFVNCKQTSYQGTCLIYKKVPFFHFYPTDLVNTKTTIPSGSVNSARFVPRRFASRYLYPSLFTSPSGIVVYHFLLCRFNKLVVPHFFVFADFITCLFPEKPRGIYFYPNQSLSECKDGEYRE